MTLCTKCRRELKNKRSIELGFGPACAKHMGIKKETESRMTSKKRPIKTKNAIKGAFA